MQELLDTIVFDSPIRSWLLALGVGIGAFTLLLLVRRVLVAHTRALKARHSNLWAGMLARLVPRTRGYFLFMIALDAGAAFLNLSPGARRALAVMSGVVLALQLGRWASDLIEEWLDHYRRRQALVSQASISTIGLLAFLGQVAIWTLVLLLVLANFGVDVTALIAGLGVGGIAIALAVQSILGDLFASLAIMFDKPFVPGDFVVVGEHKGTVDQIGLKTTRMRSISGEQLVFANADLLNSRIRNFGRMSERRVLFSIGVTYQTGRAELLRVPDLIRESIEAEEGARFDRSHFAEYGDFSLNFETVYYVLDSGYNRYMDIQQRVLLGVHERFEAEGIEFAYPTQTLYLNPAASLAAQAA